MKVFLPFTNIYKQQIERQPVNYNLTSFKGQSVLPTDTIEFSAENIYKNALSKLNKITKKEYQSLTPKEKEILRTKIQTKRFSKAVKLHDFAANNIIDFMDKKYGKNNYVIISIGRSLSSICKMLELKIGKENVKNIPMSDMGRFYSTDNLSSIEKFSKLKGFDSFKKYLKSIGLTKEIVENSNKNYIIIDYTCSGRSLSAAYSILTSNLLLGNTQENIHRIPISRILPKNNSESIFLDDIFYTHGYKDFSFVKKTNQDFTNIEEAADYQKNNKNNKQIEKIKLFGFALLDNAFGNKTFM